MSQELFNKARSELQSSVDELFEGEEKDRMNSILGLIINGMPPASSSLGRHGGFPGGLACHVRDVWSIARSMAAAIKPIIHSRFDDSATVYSVETINQEVLNLRPSSVLKVCLLHDLNKVMTINGEPHYVPNILDKGTVSPRKPWKTNPAADSAASVLSALKQMGFEDHVMTCLFASMTSVRMRDGQVSLAVAERVSPGILATLTSAEKHAVIYHDGAFVSLSDGVCSDENALQMVLHSADMIASRFLT